MSDIFLSYAREDLSRARKLAHTLEAKGWSVWWDPDIPAGKTFDRVIEEQLGSAACVIVLWSNHSVASRWVRTEADDALRRDVLVPVLIDNVTPPLAFRLVQTSDLTHWDGSDSDPRFQRLLSDIELILQKSDISPRKMADAMSGRSTLAPRPHGRPPLGLIIVGIVFIASVVSAGFYWRWLDKESAEPSPPPSAAIVPVTPSGHILVDEFDGMTGGLHKLFDQRNLTIQYTNEGLKLVAKSQGILPVLYSSSIQAQDFRANFWFRVPAPEKGGTYGLIFRSDDDADRVLDSYLLLGFNPNTSQVILDTFKNGAWKSHKSKSAWTLQKTELNHIRADVLGTTVRVFVNDTEAAYFEEVEITEPGMLGLFISAGSNAQEEVIFTRLHIYPETLSQ